MAAVSLEYMSLVLLALSPLAYILLGCFVLAWIDTKVDGRLMPWWDESPIPALKWWIWPLVVVMYMRDIWQYRK